MSSSKVFWDALRKHEAQAADAHERASANPYYSAFAWWWKDAQKREHGPYETQRAALRALLKHLQPTRWDRFLNWIAPLDDEGKYG